MEGIAVNNESLALNAAQYTGLKSRWTQLVIGIVCMAMIANLQYGWTLFVNPMHDKMGWTKAAIQIAFSVFVLTETWLVPVEGWLMDKFGPRPVVLVGGILAGLAWVLDSMAASLEALYVAAVIGGIGAGCVYGTCVGNALKWFPDRRGLAAGLTAMGYGAGSALTVFPIAAMIKSDGYEATFFSFGLGQGAIIFVLGWFLRAPAAGHSVPAKAGAAPAVSTRDYSTLEMLRSPAFYVMYTMFVLATASGLV